MIKIIVIILSIHLICAALVFIIASYETNIDNKVYNKPRICKNCHYHKDKISDSENTEQTVICLKDKDPKNKFSYYNKCKDFKYE